MQEKRKLKTKAIPAVDARPTKEGKQASTTLMSKRLPPAAGWALAVVCPKGRLWLRGKGGARVCLAGHWHGSSRSHCQREVPTAGAGASCFPWFPHPQRPSRRASQCLFDPPKYTHTHTHTARSKPTLARPYGKRRRLNKTCRLVSVQGPGAVGGLVARRSVASTYTHGLVMDVAHSSHSQPARHTATSTAMGWGKWGGGRGKRGA